MSKDEITSTDRQITYIVEFLPGREKFVVTAGNAVTAQTKGVGLAALNNITYVQTLAYPATEDDLALLRHEEEE